METHWKKLTNPDYIGAYDFAKGEIRKVKILKVTQEKVADMNGKKADCIVATLENSKPFILCKTNCKMITKLLQTPYIEDWAGKLLNVEVKPVKAFGEWVDALRICSNLPEQTNTKVLDNLTPEHAKWTGAKQAIENKQTTIEAIRKAYILTPENEKLLCENLK